MGKITLTAPSYSACSADAEVPSSIPVPALMLGMGWQTHSQDWGAPALREDREHGHVRGHGHIRGHDHVHAKGVATSTLGAWPWAPSMLD